MDAKDELYMRRCLQLAAAGKLTTRPNPMVGAVVVCGNRIIGEGYHIRPGEGHAEVNALRSVRPGDEALLPESTIYVSLEPCAHYGKTPPCADLIVKKRLRRCVVGCGDPFPAVNGGGIRKLREAGIEVEVGVLEAECRRLNAPFFTFHTRRRPYVTLKWAESADHFLDLPRPEPPCGLPADQAARISTPLTQLLVHRLRAENQAILVGRRTALLDNPSLTTRLWPGESPLRCVLMPSGPLPGEVQLADGSMPTLFFCGANEEKCHNFLEKAAVLSAESGSTFCPPELVKLDEGCPLLPQVMEELHRRGVQSLLVEGGSATLQGFLDAGLWDEIYVERAPMLLRHGVPAPVLPAPSAEAPYRTEESSPFGRTRLHHIRTDAL